MKSDTGHGNLCTVDYENSGNIGLTATTLFCCCLKNGNFQRNHRSLAYKLCKFNEQIIMLNNISPINKTRRTELAIIHENTSLLTYILI